MYSLHKQPDTSLGRRADVLERRRDLQIGLTEIELAIAALGDNELTGSLAENLKDLFRRLVLAIRQTA